MNPATTSARDSTFLPVTRSELVRVLAEEGALEDREALRAFSGLLAHVFHFLFHQEALSMKGDYAPFNPDPVNLPLFRLTREEKEARADRLVQRFEYILRRANYHRIEEEELNDLLSQASPWALKLKVDLSQYSRFCLYYRGDGHEDRAFRGVTTLYRKRLLKVSVFHRLALLVQFVEEADAREDTPSPHIYIKLFKNIPRTDLEMLFPNTVPQMKLLDKLRVMMPLIGGTGTTLIKIVGAAAISVFAALLIAVGFLGYAVKTFFGFLRVKEKYQGTLVSNLYFNSLDNNLGVIHRIIDQAEEEECKEALLAYYFLLTEPEARAGEAALDRRIEAFLEKRFDVHMNFEAPDALEKLKRLGLLEGDTGGRLEAIPLKSALKQLDEAWDGYFTYE